MKVWKTINKIKSNEKFAERKPNETDALLQNQEQGKTKENKFNNGNNDNTSGSSRKSQSSMEDRSKRPHYELVLVGNGIEFSPLPSPSISQHNPSLWSKCFKCLENSFPLVVIVIIVGLIVWIIIGKVIHVYK